MEQEARMQEFWVMTENLWGLVLYFKEITFAAVLLSLPLFLLYWVNKRQKKKEREAQRKEKSAHWRNLGEQLKGILENAAQGNTNTQLKVVGGGNEFYYVVMVESVLGQNKTTVASVEIRHNQPFPIKIRRGATISMTNSIKTQEIAQLCSELIAYDPVEALR